METDLNALKLQEELATWHKQTSPAFPSLSYCQPESNGKKLASISDFLYKSVNERRLGLYLPDYKAWAVTSLKKTTFDDWNYSEINFGTPYLVKFPKAFTGDLNVAGTGSFIDGSLAKAVGGRIITFDEKGFPLAPGQQWLSFHIGGPKPSLLLKNCYLNHSAPPPPNKAICQGALTNGKLLYSIWRTSKQHIFVHEPSFSKIRIGELRTEEKLVGPFLDPWYVKQLFQWLLFERQKQTSKKLEKELSFWPKKNDSDYSSRKYPAHSAYFPTDIETIGIKIPYIYLPLPQDTPERRLLFVNSTKRGKQIFLPLEFDTLPKYWNGSGTIQLEGVYPGNLALLLSENHTRRIFIAEGRVATGTPSFAFPPFSQKPPLNSLVSEKDLLFGILLDNQHFYALWTNPQENWLGLERITSIEEVLADDFLKTTGRFREFSTDSPYHQFEDLFRKQIAQTISL